MYATYIKGLERLHKDYDMHKLAKKVKMHNMALKTSILCGKERRQLIKRTPPYVLDIEAEEKVNEKQDYVLGFSNLKHGVCHDNERLIDTNIESRIVTGQKYCVCEEMDFRPPPPK
jgi:hypothetical protein